MPHTLHTNVARAVLLHEAEDENDLGEEEEEDEEEDRDARKISRVTTLSIERVLTGVESASVTADTAAWAAPKWWLKVLNQYTW